MNKSQSANHKVSQSAGSQQRTPKPRQRKCKCAGVNMVRMFLGLIVITFVVVITGVQVSGWEAITDALFGHITVFEVIRQAAIVILSIYVGYWMKRPRKVYIKENEKQQKSSEADEQKAEE